MADLVDPSRLLSVLAATGLPLSWFPWLLVSDTLGSQHVKPSLSVPNNIDVLIVEQEHRKIACFVALKPNGTGWGISKKLPSLLAAMILIGCLSPVLGTEVLVFLSKEWSVISVDSLIVVPGGKNFKKCKIRQFGDMFWAAAGLDFDSETGFSVDNFFTTDLLTETRVSSLLDAVGNKLVKPLQKELPQIKAKAPDYYARLLRGGNVLSFYAVKIHDGAVETYSKEIKLVNGAIVPRDSVTFSAPCILMPEVPEVQRYVAAHPEIWKGDVVKATDTLMEIARKADPAYVAPPYSILAVSPTQGIHWLRQNNCPNLKQQTGPKKR